jgi:hypothetical protein
MVVDLLLNYGADIELQNHDTELPPSFMISRVEPGWGSEDRSRNRDKDLAEAAQLLLKKGANPLFVSPISGKVVLLREIAYTPTSVVKVILDFFFKCGMHRSDLEFWIKRALRRSTCVKRADRLWRWYWPKVHPCTPDWGAKLPIRQVFWAECYTDLEIPHA